MRDVEAVVAAHPASLAQPAATTFVPKAFTVVVRRVDEGYDAGVDGALFKWLRNLRAAVDRVADEEARDALLKSVREAVAPMAKSEFDTVRVLASYWL